MANIEINDLKDDVAVSEEELKHVKGGALQLTTLQKVNILMCDGSVRTLGDGSVRTLAGDGSV